MIVDFYFNKSEHNVINKEVYFKLSTDCKFKSDSSLTNPNIIINYDENVFECNYFIIPALGRKYFIDDIIMLTGGKINIIGAVDVLESFKEDILNLEGILINSETIADTYLMDADVWKTKVKTFTEIKQFPNGLSDNGYFVLIVAGGGEDG